MTSKDCQSGTDIFHLSVVATSRNDNHGGSLTRRMQHFVDGFVAQCKRHRLRAELILVEWNPPSDRLCLAEELNWPIDTGPCDIRIITVPPEIHQRFPHSDKLPLFQMIAKNVGIRRARGKFVLATNIDILFSDQSIIYMRDRLESGFLYRADRLDVPTEIPKTHNFDDALRFCWGNYFRINANQYTGIKYSSTWRWQATKFLARLNPKRRAILLALLGGLFKVQMSALGLVNQSLSCIENFFTFSVLAIIQVVFHPFRFTRKVGGLVNVCLSCIENFFTFSVLAIIQIIFHPVHVTRRVGLKIRRFVLRNRGLFAFYVKSTLFTNACGDFTLLSSKDWEKVRGYPEWPIFSWHIDSVLLYQCANSNIREVYIGNSAPIFHIEHSKSSGYTPEGATELFSRLDIIGLPYITNSEFYKIIKDMDVKKVNNSHAVIYNETDWGLSNYSLPESII